MMMHFPIFHKARVSKIAYLGLLGSVLAIAMAGFTTIWPVYLGQFFSDSTVGFITSFFSLISFFGFFLVRYIIRNKDKMELYRISLILLFCCFILFYAFNSMWLLIIIAIFFTIISTMQVVSYGILVRDQSTKQDLGMNESIQYAFGNIGWIVGPLIAGFIMANYAPKIGFLVFSVFLLIALSFSFQIHIKPFFNHLKTNISVFRNLKEYYSSVDRIKVSLLSVGLNIWWGLVYIYLPLFIISQHLGRVWVGYALFGVALPLILLEFPVGKNADRISNKFFFINGFLILGLIGVTMSFVSSPFIIIILFSLASIGAAFVEPLKDAYFFQIIPQDKEDEFYGPYLTSAIIGGTVGKLIPAFVLLFFGFNVVFFVIGLLMFLFVGVAATMKKAEDVLS